LKPSRFGTKARETLGQYVYLYLDPETKQPLYVGKGTGNRCFTHLQRPDGPLSMSLARIKRLGLQPRIDILKYGLSDQEALLVEQTAIDLIGITSLANRVRGHGSKHGSRANVDDLLMELDAEPVVVAHSCVLINIAKNYREGMSPQDLYDATRCAWKVNPQRKPHFALSVFRGVVREVFEIVEWHDGGSTMKSSDRDGRPHARPGRKEFVGRIADDAVRNRYVGKSVQKYLPRGTQNPIRYVGDR
jgi:uncharacterized protein